MIIRHLHIDNFGIFNNYDLDLTPGFNHLVRDNEAGKSTLLEFIRRIFWGFPDRRSKLNPYPALKGSGLYGGFLDVTLDNGEEVRLQRHGQKGKLKMIYPDGRVEEMPHIGELAGISENFYRNVCAVTIDELTAFAALEDPDVRNPLYGKALNFGPLSLSELQDQLKEEEELIFKKRGTITVLKRLSLEFEASDKRLAEAAAALPAYEKAVLSVEKTENESAALKEELAQLKTQISETEAFFAAEAKRKKLAEDEEIFARKQAPPPLPEAIPAFEEKAPEAPQGPLYPELPPQPQPPKAGELEAKCDPRRAAAVHDGALEELERWYEEYSKNVGKIGRTNHWFLIAAALLLFAAGVAMLFSSRLWLIGILLIAAGTAAGAFHIRNYRQLFRRHEELKKEKENHLFRFALNPALPAEEIRPTLLLLRNWQQEQAAYEKELASFNRQQQQTEKLRYEYDVRRKAYDEKLAEYVRRRSEYDKKRQAFEEACRTASAAIALHEGEKLALVKRRNELALLPMLPPEKVIPPDELESLKEKVLRLQRKLEENLTFSGAERREASILLNGIDSAVELNVREQIRGKMRSAAERYLILSAARKVLERSVERCERERQPELLKKASLIFCGFTENAYTLLYKQLSTNTLHIANPEQGIDRSIPELSRGTREQLFLALRLALIESFEKNFETLPVILDDILVNFDSKRRKVVKETIEKFSSSRQLILLEHS